MTWKWEEVKDRIRELYINQDISLDDVILILKQERGFEAKKRTFQKRLKKWGISKRPCRNPAVQSSAQAPTKQVTTSVIGDLLPSSILPSNGGDNEIQPYLISATCAVSGSQASTQPVNDPDLALATSVLEDASNTDTTCDTHSSHFLTPTSHSSPSIGHQVAGIASTSYSDRYYTEEVTNTAQGKRETPYRYQGGSLMNGLAAELSLPPPVAKIAYAYVTTHDISIQKYKTLHQDISSEYMQKPDSSLSAEKHTGTDSTVFEISLRKLSDDHQRFLLFCSFLDGKKIPLELLSRLLNYSQTIINECVLQLLQYRLVFRTCLESISVSPDIQRWVQERLPSDKHSLDARRDVIIKMSGSVFLNRMASKEDWSFAQLAIPHLEAVIALILQNDSDSEFFWDEDLLKAAASIADVVRRFEINDKAILVLENVCHFMECSLGKKHPRTLNTMNSLSVAYISTKNWKEAESLLHTIVRSRRDSSSRDEFCYLTELINLIRVLVKRGHIEEAKKQHTVVLDCVKRFNPKNFCEKVRVETKVGESFRFCGYLMEAEGHFLRLYKEAGEVLGMGNPRTLRVLELLCHVHFDQKSWARAGILGLELVELSKQALGETQVDTVRRKAFLEEVYQKQG